MKKRHYKSMKNPDIKCLHIYQRFLFIHPNVRHMENQSDMKEKSHLQATVKIFVKFGVFLYLGLLFVLFFTITPPSEYNSFISVFMFIIGVQFIIGPFLLFIALGAYFVRLCDLSKVPKDTTLYKCITSPTLQYGPLKVIIPVIIEELIDDDDQIELSESQFE